MTYKEYIEKLRGKVLVQDGSIEVVRIQNDNQTGKLSMTKYLGNPDNILFKDIVRGDFTAIDFSACKIDDTDKVFFTKNSKFPRISFNKLSTKAKRVQSVAKADKVVANITGVGTSSRTAVLVRNAITDDIIKTIILDWVDYRFSNYSSDISTNVITNYQTEVLQNGIKELYDLDAKDYTLEGTSVRKAAYLSNNDMATLKMILDSSIPAENFITDETVNDYINQFKGEFDKPTYDYLVEVFNADDGYDVPIQLLGQLQLTEDNPYYRALFLNLERNNRYRIVGAKAMSSIDGLNLKSNYNFKRYLELSLYSVDDILRYTNEYVKDPKITNDNKELFFSLVKTKLDKEINSIYGVFTPDNKKLSITYTPNDEITETED